ncbi:helix-turn-helix transcriptional regulator [Pseudonocardia sp. KRD-184]|uniref:Helix-turn-helix transcriptional regulator n=1 Tax=Pseudonocardia oceani TaxID=2792013 RepID=A0ABS6UK75_9PSEU|nr:helix-turn-helix transcriptional regulator [Pseudonocardia oceani]MBW0088242.1 helix-turn-helix transcriptional regulator [Pseudonocardia oceani]MBW0095024.1 helix-turn-helix transcriptional regulator [Pseudonocardia oceani]MBW0121123.1 helix-turn-helix transcriptional regulator [Pseudonocardia oceani]MBW0131191.1 helix-turn-helix transcriptional regulator [Pseudonocardia oceani]MBW0132642.1 helix-turn-helix transcriptional regulator [Pseudonocardia oceani]
MHIEKKVGARIRALRDSAGLTQAQLGQLLPGNWSRQAVSSAEKGQRAFGVAELVEMATVLNVTVSDLVEDFPSGASSGLGRGLRAQVQLLRTELRRLDQALADVSDEK